MDKNGRVWGPSILATLLLVPAIAASAQNTQGPGSVNGQPPLDGTITGVVTNDDGEPILEASLCTEITYDHGSGTSCGGTQTDAQGRFSIQVPLGEIGVYAQKTDGGYWPPAVELRSPKGHMAGVKTVTLTRDAPTATVTLKIGPRPGVLKFDVKDKSTGKPVRGFRVRWIGMDNAKMWSIERSVTQVLVPHGLDVIVEVHAQGYRRWFYIDPSNPSQPTLRLASGEEKQLYIELEPEEKQ